MPIFNSKITRNIQMPTESEWSNTLDMIENERREAERIGKRARKIF